MNVLLLATSRPLPASVVEGARREFADVGEPVIDLVTWLPPAERLDAVTRTSVVLGPPQPATAAATQPANPSGARSKLARKARRLVKGGVSRGFWANARRNEQVHALAKAADVIVALDSGAIRTAWHLARRHPSAVVTLGVAAAVRELTVSGRSAS